MEKAKTIEERVSAIEQRNHNVETDKAWETSWTRSSILFLLTLILFWIYFYFVHIDHPLLNAIVPALAFVFSPLSLPFFKKLWVKYLYRK